MSQPSTIPDPHQLQAFLLNVTVELQQLEASLLRMRDETERLRAACVPQGQQADPLEKMYEDLERAIRARPGTDAARSGTAPLVRQASGVPGRTGMRLRVVPIAPARVRIPAAPHR